MSQGFTDLLDTIERTSFLIGLYGENGNSFRTEREEARTALVTKYERLRAGLGNVNEKINRWLAEPETVAPTTGDLVEVSTQIASLLGV